MKKTLLLIFCLFSCFAVSASVGFAYSAALRNASGQFLADEQVKVDISILGASDSPIYAERHELLTDNRGGISLIIGQGEPTEGSFDLIDWLAEPSYRLRVEATTETGTSVISVQELLSVPTANVAEVAEGLEVMGNDGSAYRLVVDDYGNLETIRMPKGYTRLVFHDSFNGSGLPDADKWSYDAEHINDELQYYTKERVENVFMEDGLLHIRCINNDPIYDKEGKIVNNSIHPKTGETLNITSARICTKHKADWTYCYVEARIKVPIASGTWPAVWMMPSDNVYGYWPNSGEIDIMEHVGNEPLVYHCALHHRNGTKGGSKQLLDADDWHVIGFNWTESKMEWLIDGKVYCRLTNPGTNWGDWPYNKDFHLILNLAFGGNWGGQGGIDPSALPLDFLVDYVRVFKP